MATKTLTIMEDAYNLLAENKMENESFSDEIRRILSVKKKRPLSDFFGILSEEEGEDILKALEWKRKENRKLIRARLKE